MPTSSAQCDLDFKDIVTPHPKVLTPEQIAQYNRDGYVKPFTIFNDLQAQTNRAYFDWLLARMKAQNDGRDSYAILGFHTRCQGIYDLAVNPQILDLVEDLLGPDFVCWTSHLFCKMPHDPKSVPWHQDASYWPLTPARTVTVWLAIDDVDVENACMHVIAGTHRLGHLKWKESDEPSVLGQKIDNAEYLGAPVPFELKAGQISLHADMIVHGSKPNTSDRRRCGLTLRYCPTSVVSLDPTWTVNAILCRGRDADGHWSNMPRPAGEDINTPFKPKPIGTN